MLKKLMTVCRMSFMMLRKVKYTILETMSCMSYPFKKNIRNILAEDVTSYKLFEDRSAILCLSANNNIKLFKYSKNNTISLTDSQNADINNYAVAGNDYFLFMDNFKEAKADLFICSLNGKTRKLAEGINPSKSYGFGKNDRYVFYYTENTLNLADKSGGILVSFDNAQIPKDTVQPTMIEVNTKYVKTKNETDIGYVLSNILPDGSGGDLEYLSKFNKYTVTTDVNRIIYYDSDSRFIIFSKNEGEKVKVFKSNRGKEPEFIMETTSGGKYIFDNEQGYLYINEQSGYLSRINIYDKNLRIEHVTDHASNIYEYRNKAIALYENMEADCQYYILENNKIERVSSNEKRLYGFDDDSYLLLRSIQNGSVSLDLVTPDGMKRITGNLINNLFYDKNLEEVLYTTDDSLYLWKNNKSIVIGKFAQMQAALITE